MTGEIVKPGDRIWIPYRQHSLYFGILTVLFAVVGVAGWMARRRTDLREQATSTPDGMASARTDFSDVPFWMGAAFATYICALGGFTPAYRLVFALPLGDYLRAPVKFVHLLEMCTAILAGYGLAWLQERMGKVRPWVVPVLCALVAANVLDLARVDRKYLAVEDVSFHRAANDAASDVVKLGGGKVYVAMPPQEGERLVRDSLGFHLTQTADAISEEGVRFVLASGTALRNDKTLGERWRNRSLKQAGFYSLSAKHGIRNTEQSSATLVLLQVDGVPPPDKTPPPANRLAQAVTMLSILATVGVGAWALVSFLRKLAHGARLTSAARSANSR